MIHRRGVMGLGSSVAAAMLIVAPLGAQEIVELPADDRNLDASFEDVFRIGSFDGEAWETFGEIAGTAFDEAGNLYVFDRQASRITVVDREGNFVREIGQSGEGPGELTIWPVGGEEVQPDVEGAGVGLDHVEGRHVARRAAKAPEPREQRRARHAEEEERANHQHETERP